MGSQAARYVLLTRLIKETDLVTLPNSRGESILLFLVQTVGRQNQEQRQFRNSRPRTASSNSRNKTPSSDIESDMPDHDLEPPRFSRRALECLLGDWKAVKSTIMSGVPTTAAAAAAAGAGDGASGAGAASEPTAEHEEGDRPYVVGQTGTTLLDKFTHCLFVKCQTATDALLETIVAEMKSKDPDRREMAAVVARRFVRSVVRIFVIFSIEMVPNCIKRQRFTNQNLLLTKCKRVFQSLSKISIEELCETADSLIAPVRLGVARPTAPFPLATSPNEILNGSEELFLVEPLAPSASGGRSSITEPPSTQFPLRFLAEALSRAVRARDLLNEINDGESMAIDQEDDAASEHDDAGAGGGANDVPMPASSGASVGGGGGNPSSRRDSPTAPATESEEARDGGAGGDAADSDPELDLLAETESDSDDNQSNQDAQSAQRSVQTGATAGSDTGGMLLFPEDESGESSQQEEEESEAGETDEQDTEDYTLTEDQLERRSAAGGHGGSSNAAGGSSHRTNLAPQNMQWAIRSSRETSSGGGSGRLGQGVRLPNGSNLVFIDPSSLRRSTTAAGSSSGAAAAAAVAAGIVIREIADLLALMPDINQITSSNGNVMEVYQDDIYNVQIYLEFRLKPTWDWLLTVMDATEAQLKFGASLTNSLDPSVGTQQYNSASTSGTSTSRQSNRLPVTNSSTAFGNRIVGDSQHAARREFLSYCLSLMRAHNSEHLDSLPVLDVSALKHVAYVFDALIYFMRSGTADGAGIGGGVAADGRRDGLPLPTSWADQDENENEEAEDDIAVAMDTESLDGQDVGNLAGNLSANLSATLARSESTLCLGCPPPDPFDTPMAEALPLADQPHLLQPNARREDLFGIPKQPVTLTSTGSNSGNPLESLPTKLSLSTRTSDYAMNQPARANQPISRSLNMSQSSSMSHVLGTNESSQDISSQSTSTSTISSCSTPSTSSSRSPAKSVIVRAGSSNSQKMSESEILSAAEIPQPETLENQEISANVTVITTPSVQPEIPRPTIGQSVSHDLLLGRWRLSLDLFGRVFMEDVGLEPGSIVSELGGFPVKEAKFRRDMEKLRNNQQRDLTLSKIERDRTQLLVQTFKELNTQYNSYNRRAYSSASPPLAVSRVKVTFKDEPGEGSGVARSFYTAVAQAILSNENLPNLEQAQVDGKYSQYSVLQSCKKLCFRAFSVEDFNFCITKINGFSTKDEQDIYLQQLIEKRPVKKHRPRKENSVPRQYTFEFSIDVPSKKQVVCKQAFIAIYGISQGRSKYPSLNVKYQFYAKYFKDNFSLRFGRPQVDTCITCEELTVKIKSPQLGDHAKRAAEAELSVHKRRAKKFHNKISEIRQLCQTRHDVAALSFDFMQNLPLPHIPVQDIFYLRQLWVNCFGIKNLKTNKTVFYVFHEGVANKGSNEICSMLLHYIDNFLDGNVQELFLFSDNCPVRGHSFLPNDQDFGVMKRKIRKHDRIFIPDQYYSIMSNASPNFKVFVIKTSQIYNFSKWWPLYYKRNCLSDESFGKKVPKEQKQSFTPSSFMSFEYNQNKRGVVVAHQFIDGLIYHTFSLLRTTSTDVVTLPLTEQAYPNNWVPINPKKIRNIQQVQSSILDEYQPFYQEILGWPTTENVEETDVEDDKELRRDRDVLRRSAPSRTGSSKSRVRRALSVNARPFVPAQDAPQPPAAQQQQQQDGGGGGAPSMPDISAAPGGGGAELDVFSLNDRGGRKPGTGASGTRSGGDNPEDAAQLQNQDEDDNAPLFYCPGKRGFYAPRQGKATYERLLGLCLLQNELCPIFLTRHVLKSILDRPIKFHDLAFFDPVVYESLRQLVVDAETKDGNSLFSALGLNFTIDLCPQEGGGTVELMPGGKDIEVTATNVYDYVRKYAKYRMIKVQEKAIESIRTGVFDVLPEGSLDGLTAEDLRLLLNGVGDINVAVLISYTSFNDESGESGERLVYFWTGSPALPASEDGFQPMPSVTIRPADDAHLPTANTCISRLYIPLYSSRTVLRQKLLLAIKTKNFGKVHIPDLCGQFSSFKFSASIQKVIIAIT
ncbi:unnamed protein product [Callosobruchus maculatus]|uniref:HECT domain-containing protein n=1 Tax=Callosobruchus maculatus TaxID=64391 RepID=A0A653C9A6_CALMS|nr:unnamed protein product [Callosobruchus maculatus]